MKQKYSTLISLFLIVLSILPAFLQAQETHRVSENGRPPNVIILLADDLGYGDLSCYGSQSRSEEHTSELQSLMRISYAVFCLKKKTQKVQTHTTTRKLNKLT